MHEPEPRSVRCRDVMGRQGAVSVLARDGEAVLTVPPGEAARLSGQQLSQLIEALCAVRIELFRTES